MINKDFFAANKFNDKNIKSNIVKMFFFHFIFYIKRLKSLYCKNPLTY